MDYYYHNNLLFGLYTGTVWVFGEGCISLVSDIQIICWTSEVASNIQSDDLISDLWHSKGWYEVGLDIPDGHLKWLWAITVMRYDRSSAWLADDAL